MTAVRLQLPLDVRAAVWRHLLPNTRGPEEAAFVFARASTVDGDTSFDFIEWSPVTPEGFASRSAYHLELSDETRAGVIKRAHDLGASVAEFHSHRGNWAAQFSPSDWAGFEEFVPHIWWRLKGRPYAAVVVSATGFDGLAWLDSAAKPVRLDALISDGTALMRTGLSPLTKEGYAFHVK